MLRRHTWKDSHANNRRQQQHTDKEVHSLINATKDRRRVKAELDENALFPLQRNDGFAMIAGEHTARLLAVDVHLVASDLGAVQPRLTPLYHRLVVAPLHRAIAVMVA